MTIIEMAVELGNAIKADERLLRYANAREAYAADKELQVWLTEYKTQKLALDEQGIEEVDADFKMAVENRMAELYKQIMDSPTMEEFSDAETAVNTLLNQVNRTISQTISGQAGCSESDCASCAGCK